MGYTTAKRFNGSPFLGMAIGVALVYHNILVLASAEPISVLFECIPSYAQPKLRELALDITEKIELLKNTVDFLSFSYYNSKVCSSEQREG